jgi:DNA-binding IclR family transcriptional regulator
MDNSSERSEVSLHEIKVLHALMSNPDKWLTHKEISQTSRVNERTTRAHTLRLVKLGMLEKAEVFPAHKYRWSAKASKRNAAYAQRIEQAIQVFGPEVLHGA